MQINKFVAIGAIALVSIGAIAWVNSVKYEEEKKAARSEAKGYELECVLFDTTYRIAEYMERDSKADPRNDKLRKEAFEAREKAITGQKACQKIQEYKEKYEN